MNSLVRYYETLSPAQKTAVVVGGIAVAAATGGALAYAVLGAESVILVAGPVVLATNKAANILARGV